MSSLELQTEDIKTSTIDEDIRQNTLDILSKDFDTPNLITYIYQLMKQLNKTGISKDKAILVNSIIWQFHLLGMNILKSISDEDVQILNNWKQARNDKFYELADELRNKLMKKGYL